MFKPETEDVKMEDGRAVTFAGKRRMLKTHFVNEQKDVAVRFDFRNGKVRTFVLPKALVLEAAGHGASQKMGDYVANSKDMEDDDLVLEIEEIGERIAKGEWNVVREAGTGVSGTSVLLRAIVELRKLPVDTVKAFLKTKTPAEKMAMRNSTALNPIIVRLEAEKTKKAALDGDSILGDLPSA